MIRKLVFVCLAAFTVASFSSCKHRRGSGHVVSENHPISDFTRLNVGGPFDVEFTQAATNTLELTGDDNLLKYVEIKNQDGELSVKVRKGEWFDVHRNLQLKVSAQTLEELNLAGSGNVTLKNGYKGDNALKMAIAGAGNVSGKVDVPEFTAEIAGSGSFDIQGQTRKAKIDVMGSGDFNGFDLLTEETAANIAGSGNIHVSASMKLDADIAGSGDVRYKGSPAVSSHVGGSGSVSKD